MCRESNKWFYPYEFMNPELGSLYVGYKAPTRIAEMHKKYPRLFETRSEDKYVQRRLNTKQRNQWYEYLDKELQDVVDRELPEVKAVSWMYD